MKPAFKIALLSVALAGCATSGSVTSAVDSARIAPRPPQAEDAYFQAGAARAAAPAQVGRARNVILFVGDGMGIATVTAARIYAGQRLGRDGESYALTMDTFPNVAFSRTYGHDAQISDSAPTATALVSGVKTNEGVLGLTGGVRPRQCEGADQFVSRSIFAIAEDIGMATGVVSTARLTHATPASTYSHTAGRDWESDTAAALSGGANCRDIARQFAEWSAGDGFEIALGGGRTNFLPSTKSDPEISTLRGARSDGRDLTAEWAAKPNHVYVWNGAQLAAAAPDAHILGLFSPSHMAYESQRANDSGGEPSLSEMTATAIRRLQREPNGYVLMIEGGRIDHAHHEGRAGEALSETVAYDNAIRTALEMTSRDDTLIIVTADHSHTLSISGYARRGNPILGLSSEREDGAPTLAADGKPYTTLGYMNGPGAVFSPVQDGAPPPPAVTRPDLRGVDTQALSFHQQALYPGISETHGGEDVPLYAWGPGDEGIGGTMEENAVFHVMVRALGITWR